MTTPDPSSPSPTAREQILGLLSPDPRDPGCEAVFELLDEYVEIVARGGDPELTMPGITAHLAVCGPCVEDYRGLLALLSTG